MLDTRIPLDSSNFTDANEKIDDYLFLNYCKTDSVKISDFLFCAFLCGSTDSPSSEDTSVGSNEKSENFVVDYLGQELSGNQRLTSQNVPMSKRPQVKTSPCTCQNVPRSKRPQIKTSPCTCQNVPDLKRT